MSALPILSLALLPIYFTPQPIFAVEPGSNQNFAEWTSTYLSSNPFSALKKSTPFNVTKSAVDDLTDGDGQVNPSHFQYLLRHGIDKLTLSNIINELKKDIAEDNFELEARDFTLRANIENFIKTESGKETLKIAYVGMFHAIDFYLIHPDVPIAYAAKPIKLKSEQYSQGYRDLMYSLSGKKYPARVEDDIHSYAWATYNWVLSTLAVERRKMPAYSEEPAPSNVPWIIGEQHNINETNWLESLPTASNLKSAGISRIVVGFEGTPSGPTDFQTIIKRHTLIEQFEYRAKKLGLTFEQLVGRLPPAIQRQLLAGEVQHNPAVIVFLRRLKEYQSQGIEIELQGLESPNYDPLEG